jgi:hypothetical protein
VKVETKRTKRKPTGKKWKFGPLPDSVIRAQEQESALASLDIIEAFYRLKPLERAVIEAILKEVRGERQVFTIANTFPKNPEPKKGDETFEDALLRLAYYYRPVLRDEEDEKQINWRTHWLSGYADEGDGRVIVSVDQKVLRHLKILKSYLSRRSFSARFMSQYSVRLYEWAWQHRRAGSVRLTLEELRRVLGVNEVCNEKGVVIRPACLELWPNLKQRALDRAVREISLKSNLSIEVVSTGRAEYRKVTAVAFRIREKPDSGEAKNKELGNQRLEREPN